MIESPQDGYARFQGEIGIRLRRAGLRVVVTGSSGWLGMAALEMLSGALGLDFERRVVCFGSSRRELILRSGLRVAQRPLAELPSLEPAPSLVLHLAYLTRDKISQMPLAEYAEINRGISSQVVGALGRIGARAIFVASSGAVYEAIRMPDHPQAVYGALKLEDEARFAAWAEQAGSSAILARVFNISGPYINKRGTYALASFIADALSKRPIEVRADRPVIRSFVAVDELFSVVFHLMLEEGPIVWRFDTAGEEVEVGELAAQVEEALGGVRTTKPRLIRHPEPDRYVGAAEPYASLCARAGVARVALREQILETARFIEAESTALPLDTATAKPS